VAQGAASPHAGAITIRGTVREASGQLVGDASVRLEKKDGSGVQETKTNAAGEFTFQAPGTGTYLFTAEKAGRRGRATVLVSSPGEQPRVSLVLDKAMAGIGQGNVSEPASQAMEFSDSPNFTVAAVTDWTAAGGHGSDATLRTSEALTRETLTLKPQDAKHGADVAAGTPGEKSESESRLRAAQASVPGSFEANYKLGAFYLHAGRYQESIPLLRAAYKIDPGNYDNEYDLALALKGSGEFAAARRHVERLLAHSDNADLHRLAGEIDEKLGDPLAAVHEYERAVREDPSEQNYFAWGSELLFHRAVWQAKAVFEEGVKKYPKSGRMLTALGAALFAGALYDEAALRLCAASDLNPADPEPYIFMGKIEMASPNPLACVEQKLARFVRLQPDNSLANYFYAMTIWKQQGQTVSDEALGEVEAMLAKAVAIDPKCSGAFLQLGNLSSSQRNYQKAIEFYSKAIAANSQLSEAHYRLGVAYDRAGDREKARQEFQLHDEIEKQQAAAVERQRREIKQFLVVVPGK
jgi:tetratricopeptide (TPR) repeat protein